MRSLKRDLLQGLLSYPVPAYDDTSRSQERRPSSDGFYQKIRQQPRTQRLSRRRVAEPERRKPFIIDPIDREAVWQNLRKSKNI